MALDSHQQARGRLEGVAGRPDVNDPKAHWAPARQLELDAALLGKVLLASANHQQSEGRIPDVTTDDLAAALELFEQIRNQVDQLETQVVIEARRRGMDWRQIAPHQGLGSSQAASQRYQRLMTRLEEIRQGVR
ncbi:hypothetical protein ABIA33_004655 [Streptacidiphilus sp. MAP12-16]|uniref:hypothetical protein n=1 Tax=Streptacidiphilus sp. MAP12-16 TaxID=3156300 RepID=UPI00351729F5